MKWNEIPLWLRLLIVIAGILLIAYLVKCLVEYVREHKNDWYRQWLAKQREIRELMQEKHRVLVLLQKAKRYAVITLTSLKVGLLIVFIAFTHELMQRYHMDVFSALGASAATVVTVYSVTACLFNRKIRGLNELHEMAGAALEEVYQRYLNAEPARLVTIDIKLETLRKEAVLLEENLRS